MEQTVRSVLVANKKEHGFKARTGYSVRAFLCPQKKGGDKREK